MRELAGLAVLLARLEDQLQACMRCGFCQAACPLYAQTGREEDVARGKLALLRGLLERSLAEAEEVRRLLERCLLCGACAAACPRGVEVMEIFLQARAALGEYLGLPAAKRLVLRGLLARPTRFHRVLAAAPRLQGLLTRPARPELDTACLRLPGRLGRRHLKRLAEVPLHRRVALRTAAADARVLFFSGCLIDKVFPGTGLATLAALERQGLAVEVPAAQGCCGLPALAAGDRDSFLALLRHNLGLFSRPGVEAVVTACATCAATLRRFWPLAARELPPAERRTVEAVAARVQEVSTFLAAVGPRVVHRPRPAPSVTCHDPCHLTHSLAGNQAPREVLSAAGARLVEMARPQDCCGLGGSFALQHRELSLAIGRRKLEQVLATGAQVVVTSCPACMLQLSELLSQAGAGVQVRHVVEIYAQALAGEEAVPA